MKTTSTLKDPILISPGRKTIFEEGRETKFISEDGQPKKVFARYVFCNLNTLLAKKFPELVAQAKNNRCKKESTGLEDRAMFLRALYVALRHVASEDYCAALLRPYAEDEEILRNVLIFANRACKAKNGFADEKQTYRMVRKYILNTVLCYLKQEREYIQCVRSMESLKEKYIFVSYKSRGGKDATEHRWLHKSIIAERDQVCLIIANSKMSKPDLVLSERKMSSSPMYRGLIIIYMKTKYPYFNNGVLSFLIGRTPGIAGPWLRKYDDYKTGRKPGEEADRFLFLLGLIQAEMKKWEIQHE